MPPVLILLRASLTLAAVFTPLAHAQGQLPVPRLVANLNTTPDGNGSHPHDFQDVDGKLVFALADGTSGPRLWLSNGSTAGTLAVTNPLPDTISTWDPRTWVKAGGKWFFASARVDDGKMRLWTTDGSGPGTAEMGNSAHLAAFPAAPQNLTACGGLLYFTVDHGLGGIVLWRSDGTNTGTFPLGVGDLDATPPYAGFVSITRLTPSLAGDELWFAAGDSGVSRLCRTGGTLETTVEVDYTAKFREGSIYSIVPADDGVFFTCYGGNNFETILAKTDGSVAGTVEIGGGDDSTPGLWRDPGNLYYWNGALYFSAWTNEQGDQLYRSDGTVAGTAIVKVIGPSIYAGSPKILGSTADFMFMQADDGKRGRQIWRSDGTAKGTQVIKRLGKGLEGIDLRSYQMIGDKLWFIPEGQNPLALWVSDGSAKGTRMVKSFTARDPDADIGIERLGAAGGVCYMSASDGVYGFELWKSDGTAKGTVMVKDIAAGEGSGVYPGNDVTVLKDSYYFIGEAGLGASLWRSDGSTQGTTMVRNFGKEAGPGTLSAAAGRLNLLVWNSRGQQVWSSDGTPKGTHKEKNFSAPPQPERIAEAGGKAFAVISKVLYLLRPGNREGPLRLDAAGLVADGSGLHNPLAVMNGRVYFGANGSGPSLWSSDGTAAGTVQVKLLAGLASSSTPFDAIELNGSIYFLNRFGNVARLWQSDGSEAGTTSVAESPQYECNWLALQACAGKLYIWGKTPGGELRLFVREGSGAPLLLKSFTAAGSNLLPRYFHPGGNLLYFAFDDPVHGEELWRSDGTAAGTFLVKDIYPGTGWGAPGRLVTVGLWTYFTADDNVHGFELWRTDGSTENTTMVADLWSGPAASWPEGLRLVGDRVLFSAGTNVGRELWAIDNASAVPASPALAPLIAKAMASESRIGGEDPATLLQHAFNIARVGDTTPMIPGSGSSGYPAISANGELLRVEYLRRKDGSLIYTPQYSASLAPGSFQPMSGSFTVTDIDSVWERVIAEQPYDPATTPRLFARVEVRAR